MGIQSFTPTSGGFPGQSFIDQVYMTYKVRKWTKSGGPGYYRATSALNKDGYVYYLLADNSLVQAPINGIANVTQNFTEIRILATQFDMISLYKVSAKGTDSLTLTANYTTITSSGLYTFPNNDVGFCDALIVGAGGSAPRHGGGGGGGGMVEVTSIPLSVGGTFSVTVGTYPGQDTYSNGGNTVFLGHTALGGGSGGGSGGADNGSNGPTGGGGTVASASATRSGGSGGSQTPQLNSDKAQSTWLATLGNSLTVPLLQQAAVNRFTGSTHNGGSINGSGHTGGGGGGAAGNGADGSGTTPGVGGPGVQYNFGDGLRYYSAGGGGANHTNSNNGPGGGTGWNNSAGHYGMGGDSEHNGSQNGTGGVVIVRTWKV